VTGEVGGIRVPVAEHHTEGLVAIDYKACGIDGRKVERKGVGINGGRLAIWRGRST
jgi:hypothetical protein